MAIFEDKFDKYDVSPDEVEKLIEQMDGDEDEETPIDDVSEAYDIENEDLDAVNMYLKQMAQTKVLTQREEIALAKRMKAGDKYAKDKLCESNLRLVVAIAKQYKKKTPMPFLDLIQEGNLGLMMGIERYDYRKGYKLSTYCTNWIKHRISKLISEHNRAIRIPTHTSEIVYKIVKVKRLLEQEMGREPSIKELAAEMGCEESKIIEAFTVIPNLTSLDAPVNEENDTSLGDMVQGPENVEDSVLSNNEQAGVRYYIKNFTNEKEQFVIDRVFGFYDGIQWTLGDIGKELGVSKERVRQIKESGMEKIKPMIVQARARGEI